jgi:hypothetical protein
MDQGCQMVPIFSNQKYQFGKILEGFEIEDVDIHILWPFGIFSSQ